jgi:hypothetical protein
LQEELSIHMPIVAQELFYEYLRKVAAIRFRCHSIAVRQKEGEKASESVLKRFTAAIEGSAVPSHMELLFPGKMKAITAFIAKDPREITDAALLECFWSTKLFIKGRLNVRPELAPHARHLRPCCCAGQKS